MTMKHNRFYKVVHAVHTTLIRFVTREDTFEPDPDIPENEILEPFTLTIRDQNDLRKLNAFHKKHLHKCGGPDTICAWFSYDVLPTGLGNIWTVRCPSCGKKLTLDGDFG